MRIGVLTYHCVPNFGAQLQATSTVGCIKRMGHEAVVLHWYPRDLEELYIGRQIPQEQIKVHNDYTKRVLPVTEILRTEEDLLRVIDQLGLNAIFVGSDALFKYVPQKFRYPFSKRKLKFVARNVPSVEKLEGNPFFGGFITKIPWKMPVVAFSVSSQNSPYFAMNEQEKVQMRSAMENFLSITVRDQWTKEMVENILGVSGIAITPDPVFSFNQNCYVNLPSKEKILSKFNLDDNYLLLSFSNRYSAEFYISKIAKEAERRGYVPVAFPMPEGLVSAGMNAQIRLPLDPIDWYALIKYSAGYVGERMHPIVVCLHNAVPFFSFDEYGITRKMLLGIKKKYLQNSSKTYHILEKADLTKWLFSYKKDKILPLVSEVIDKIEHFEKTKCALFSFEYQKLYEQEMQRIIYLINQKA